MKELFSGVCTALVTPFNRNCSVDYLSLQKLLQHQIKNNIKTILILGTTGESSTITFEERKSIIEFCKKLLPPDIKLIVGVGSNNTATAIQYVKQATECGVDGLLAVTPYYNKCTQQGCFQYYKTLSDNTNLPIIIYNVPSRTGFDIDVSTLQKLQSLSNIVGIKEASLDINHILQVFNAKLDYAVYCGNDNLNFIFKSLGSSGTISVVSNVYPQIVTDEWQNDIKYQQSVLCEINNLLFVEPNPIPTKYALSKLKLCKNILRPPLTLLSFAYCKKLDYYMSKLKEDLV